MGTRPSPVRRRLVATLLAGALLLGGCGPDGPDGATGSGGRGLAGIVRSPALSVGDVALPDVSADGGDLQPMRADDGDLLLVYFGYTSCPDICPTTMSDISVALGELDGEQAERVTVAMVTVDPERDTGEVLTTYLGHFFERGLALRTEDPAALVAAADAFGVRFEVEDHAEGALRYEVSHSAITYVVDDTGAVVVEWPFGMDSLDMAADLRTILTEESP